MELFYEILFRVNVNHRFYDDLICKDLYFEPTQECLRLLRGYRLQFKNTTDGFVILSEKKDQVVGGVHVHVPIVSLDTNTAFNFNVYSRRKDFLNITDADLTVLKNSTRFFFRNTTSNPSSISGTIQTFIIHNSTQININNAIQLSSTLFSAPILVAQNPVKLALRDYDNNLIMEKNIHRNSDNVIVGTSLLLSRTPFPENIYKLEQVNASSVVTSSEYYFLTDDRVNSNVDGILQLNYNTFIAASASTQYNFEIKLRNRKIHWVYRLQVDGNEVASQNYNPGNLRLNSTGPILGSAFTKTILPGVLSPPVIAVITFESNNTIDMKESPYRGIELLDSGTVLSNLPNPDTLYLSKSINHPGEYQSESAIKIK